MSAMQFARGRYRIVREIGRGGMGRVYEARDLARDVPVALKTVAHAEAPRIAQLKREFRTVAGLRHRNLVNLYDLVAERDTCFFTMELVVGRGLRNWVCPGQDVALAHADTGFATTAPTVPVPIAVDDTGPQRGDCGLVPAAIAFDEQRVRQVLAGLASGLQFLHEHGVVHRDVKPSNALVTDEGVVKLLDFGLAAAWRGPVVHIRSSETVAGTIAYMAPEYLHGQEVSPAIDLYALGVVAYELMTGAPPFAGTFYELVAAHVERIPTPAGRVNARVPGELDELISDLLAKDPAARPSAEEVGMRLVGAAPRSGPRRARAGRRFVGRAEELAALRDALERARGGRPELVLVRGRSGAGKTALLERFVSAVPARHTVIFAGRCYEREDVPYRAFDQIIEELAADAAERRLFEGDRAAAAGALAQVFPAFGSSAGADAAAPDAADPRVLRERAFEAVAGLLAERIGDGVGVMTIDDLQWADADSLELLSVLCDRTGAGALPLLIACSFREEDIVSARALRAFLGRAAAIAEMTPLRLGPLAEFDLRRLVTDLSAASDLSDNPNAIDRIVRASAGSPYVAEALAHAMSAAPPPAGAEIDVAALEASRIDGLGPAERAALDAAAVAGGPVSFSQLAHVSGLPPPRLLGAVHALEVARLVRVAPTSSGDVAYDLYHARVRAVVYPALAEDARRALHRRFAADYERRAAAGAAGVDERLAEHWGAAGDRDRAAAAALRAAESARAQLAFEHAAALYGRALDFGLGASAAKTARERRAEAVLLAGDFERAAELCRALAGARTGPARERWLLRCAEAEIKLGDLDRGVDTLEQLLARRGLAFRKPTRSLVVGGLGLSARVLVPALVGRRPKRTPAAALAGPEHALTAELYRVAANFLSTPFPWESWEFVLRSIDHARARGDAAAEACGLAMVSGYLEAASLGRFGGRFGRAAERRAREACDPYADMVVTAVGAMRAITAGDWPAMRAATGRGEALCHELGMERSWEASFLRTYAGIGELYAGEADRAVALLGELIRPGRTDDLFTRTVAGCARGRALALAGRLDEAAAVAADLRRGEASIGLLRLWTDAVAGDLALARGDYAGALAVAARMRTQAAGTGLLLLPFFRAVRHALAATAHLGAAHTRPGRAGRAHSRGALAHALALRRLGRGSFYEPTALRLAAQAHAAAGNPRRARAALARAGRAAAARGGRIERQAIAALASPAGAAPARRPWAWIAAGAIE